MGRGVRVAATATMVIPMLLVAPVAAAADPSDCSTGPWMDNSASPQDRAEALLAASTLHQKYRWLVEQPANNRRRRGFSGVSYPVQVPTTSRSALTLVLWALSPRIDAEC
jgi:beta-glucosidase